MKTFLTIVLFLAMPYVGSGQGESDLRLRLCLEGRAQDLWNPLRASEDGVVVCATTGNDVENTRVVTFIDDVMDTFSINNLRLSQGVLVDSTIFFAVYKSISGVAEYDMRTQDMLFYQHEENSQGRLSVQISNFGSNLVAYDRLYGPTLVNTERHTLKVADPDWRFGLFLSPWELFRTEDSVFMLSWDACFVIPIGTSKLERLYPSLSIWRSNVSIIDNSARWIARDHTLLSYSQTTRTLDSTTVFKSDEHEYSMASVGKRGMLTVSSESPYGELDTLVVWYHSFDKRIVRNFPITVCGSHRCYDDYLGVGWSKGVFYLTVGSPDSMMCIYSYKEPEPISSSVEEEAKEPSSSLETTVVMSHHEFDAWRRELTSSYEMYDLYGNTITTSAVGVGVVFVVFDDHHARVLVVP
jgi:hypothetical protein